MPDFLLPDLGEGLTEAEVVAWRVSPGDRVNVDQVVAEVETAKAVVEVPVPYAGVVVALHAPAGSTLSVGQPLLTVDAARPAGRRSEPDVGEPGPREPGLREPGLRHEPGVGGPGLREPGVTVPEQAGGEEASGSVLIGYGTGPLTGSRPVRSRRGRRRGPAGPGPVSAPGPGLPDTPAVSATPTTPATSAASTTPTALATPAVSVMAAASTVPGAPGASAAPASRPAPAAPSVTAAGPHRPIAVISPLVRKQARDAGLNLTALIGTGPGGVISRGDVRRAIAGLAARQDHDSTAAMTAPANPTVPANPAIPAPSAIPPSSVTSGLPGTTAPAAEPGERRVPLRGARRAAADRLSRSRREIPEATVWVDVDATELVQVRRALNAADPARPVSLLALLARFTLLGLRRYPELNARVEQDEIVITERVNLGFAAQTDHGLVVPVVRDAHHLTTRELSSRLARCTAAARERKLTPHDLAGGTFTVNNYGVFGVDGSAAIINHPEVAILGMGRVIDRPWVVDGQLAVRKVTELTLAFDHRACDGGTAGGFLRYVADCLESPSGALGDL